VVHNMARAGLGSKYILDSILQAGSASLPDLSVNIPALWQRCCSGSCVCPLQQLWDAAELKAKSRHDVDPGPAKAAGTPMR
jgi:hypothetical protein